MHLYIVAYIVDIMMTVLKLVGVTNISGSIILRI